MNGSYGYRPVTADEFLEMDFGPDRRAELDDGVIRMMAGGAAAHARVQANLLAYLRVQLRGTRCRPYGSDLALRVSDSTVRYPDVAIYCDEQATLENDEKKAFSRPRVIFEVLSASTATVDQGAKLAQYQDLPSVEAVVFIDPDAELVRVVTRLGPQSFRDDRFGSVRDVELPSLGLRIPREEIFSRD
ncbi:MAG: Uma2 family endonuclease [Myxococcales bacterium]|nr:Uma2 family endonuclease [Myxococcales bacterium]